MPYKCEVNRFNKKSRLVWYGTERGKVAPRSQMGTTNRRTLPVGEDGSYYHVTKGWRFVPEQNHKAVKSARDQNRLMEKAQREGV